MRKNIKKNIYFIIIIFCINDNLFLYENLFTIKTYHNINFFLFI